MKTKKALMLATILSICFSALTVIADENLGVLQSNDKVVPVGVSEKAYDQFIKSLSARDDEGVNELISAGQLFNVAPGTKIRILDRGVFTTEVRILSGPHEGQRGFTSTSLIH